MPRPYEEDGIAAAAELVTPTPTTAQAVNTATSTATPVPPAFTTLALSPTATLPAAVTPTSTPSTSTATQSAATATATPTSAAGATATLPAASPTATLPAGATATATATAGTPGAATATPILGTPTVGTLTATPTATPIPAGSVPNDDFGSAVAISAFPFSTAQDVTGATEATDDPEMGTFAGPNSRTVWFRFVAPSTTSVRATTSGSSYDTVLAIFTGSRGTLNIVANNDDIEGATAGGPSEISFQVQSGTTYHVVVAQFGERGADPRYGLQFRLETGSFATATPTTPTAAATTAPTATSTPSAPAPNDDFGSAITAGSLPFTDQRNTTGATNASDDPEMGNGGRNSNTVWYRFTPTVAGNVVAGTQLSSYDTVLAVFTGSRGNLTLVTSNDDISSVVQSEVQFTAQAGTTYYLEVAQYGDAAGGGDLRLRVDSGTGLVSGTPTPTGTMGVVGNPTAVGTPSVLGSSPIVIPPMARLSSLVPMDSRYFPQTGFRVNLDPIWDFFQKRGGVRAFGYPISWEFPFMGFKVQLFQRSILQLTPSGSVVSMNLMDEGLMPYTQINGSSFPRVENELKETAPTPSDPEYAQKALAFLQANVPDQWEEMQVNFLSAYMGTVRYEDAFPNGVEDASLVPLLNLELWGLPTSRPARDPNNEGFVYQRFQRGILHHDTTTGFTQGLLLADYMKSIITGENLPRDLDSQARSSRFYRQLDPAKPGHLARPADLGGTNLEDAFTRVLE